MLETPARRLWSRSCDGLPCPDCKKQPGGFLRRLLRFCALLGDGARFTALARPIPRGGTGIANAPAPRLQAARLSRRFFQPASLVRLPQIIAQDRTEEEGMADKLHQWVRVQEPGECGRCDRIE